MSIFRLIFIYYLFIRLQKVEKQLLHSKSTILQEVIDYLK